MRFVCELYFFRLIQMGAFFESALLFSLAVLIVLIGLLVYYFKGRVTELEQNNAKCLEIISDVYNSHAMLKQTVTAMLMEAAEDSVHDEPLTAAPAAQAGGYINVEIEEREPDDSSRVSYTDDESMGFDTNAEDLDIDTKDLDTKDYKMIHVDLDAHDDTYELDEEEMDEDNEDVVEQVILDESAPNIQVLKSEAEVDRPVTPQTIAPLSEDYKKMSAVALRGYIISKGIQTDTAKLRRMNKQELIDLVTQAL
jgi:hypothetical protein